MPADARRAVPYADEVEQRCAICADVHDVDYRVRCEAQREYDVRRLFPVEGALVGYTTQHTT